MAASDYVPIFFKNRLHLAGRPQMGSRPNPGRPPDRKRDLWTHQSNSRVDPITDRKVIVFGDRTTPDLRGAQATTRFHLLGLQRRPCRLLRARSGYGDQISQRLNV